jgi:hypothetical protein
MTVHVFTNNGELNHTVRGVTEVKIDNGVLTIDTRDSTFNYPLVNVQCWRTMKTPR